MTLKLNIEIFLSQISKKNGHAKNSNYSLNLLNIP